jgi:cytochrome c-type biogenesis protein CcmE
MKDTIYKLFTSTLTLILSAYGENIKYYTTAKKDLEKKEAHQDNYNYS